MIRYDVFFMLSHVFYVSYTRFYSGEQEWKIHRYTTQDPPCKFTRAYWRTLILFAQVPVWFLAQSIFRFASGGFLFVRTENWHQQPWRFYPRRLRTPELIPETSGERLGESTGAFNYFILSILLVLSRRFERVFSFIFCFRLEHSSESFPLIIVYPT